MIQVTTLAELKRHFKAGHGITMGEFELNGIPQPDPRLGEPRYPQQVKANSVVFDDGCELGFGKAAGWSFMVNDQGEALAICDDGTIRITYVLID